MAELVSSGQLQAKNDRKEKKQRNVWSCKALKYQSYSIYSKNNTNMPQKFKKYEGKNKILDGRVKITPDKYPEIRELYKQTKSSPKIAKIYGVTKKIILFIVNPEYKERDRQRRIDGKVWLRYYNTKYNTMAKQKFRNKKRALGF